MDREKPDRYGLWFSVKDFEGRTVPIEAQRQKLLKIIFLPGTIRSFDWLQ